ncbi:hypothetical protein TWF192_006088 [Orbilia oligospora]|uniref:Uncharacterized protein n=1 Tax=Orbilia oligospora TaxID=2813651 RepID=A0A6G1M9J8_ORBOL|nr:hypothetical protein TWF679_004872 [Orbilia oligospora]KAF3225198.1 hypothetical protein TWF191_005484 [Orbilia oligospora]KAF3249143.1 hypothetical protein TWF192_006088 [Orbilia oligospora]
MLTKSSGFYVSFKLRSAGFILLALLSFIAPASSNNSPTSAPTGVKSVALFARILSKDKFTLDRYTSKNVGALNYAGVYLSWPQSETTSLPLRGYSDLQINQRALQKTSTFQYDTCNQILRFNPSYSKTEAYWLSFDTSNTQGSITPLTLTTAFMSAARIQHHMNVRSWDPLLKIGMEYVSFADLDANPKRDKGSLKITKPVKDMVNDAPLKVCIQNNNLSSGFGLYIATAVNTTSITKIGDEAVTCSSAELYLDYGSNGGQEPKFES